jgi:hypothetical protein
MLVGYGTSADAYHLTAGPEDGNGARRAMETAIRQAGVTVDEIDHGVDMVNLVDGHPGLANSGLHGPTRAVPVFRACGQDSPGRGDRRRD